jgi:hypothetical protein
LLLHPFPLFWAVAAWTAEKTGRAPLQLQVETESTAAAAAAAIAVVGLIRLVLRRLLRRSLLVLLLVAEAEAGSWFSCGIMAGHVCALSPLM